MLIDPISTPVKGHKSLLEAIASVPIPGAPPRLSKDGAAVGLAFLDIALRQNHVRRLTERLTLVEHRTARRTIEVDVSLGMLDRQQRDAGLLYQSIRSRGASAIPGAKQDATERPDTLDGMLWVPVSLARRTHSPVDIVDAAGNKLPRLTQYETSRLMASAMYRLFRLILSSQPQATRSSDQPDSELRAFLFRQERPRWLLQAALVTLLTERNKPSSSAVSDHDYGDTPDGNCRRIVEDVFKRYRAALREYIDLLDIVVNDHLLVVALDPRRDEHLLAFDAPLHIEQRPRRSVTRLLRLANGPYWVRYETTVPATLRAYHLVAETEDGLEIDTMSLSSDADQSAVADLTDDLTTLAERVPAKNRHKREVDRNAVRKIELELQAVLRRLSEVLRRRRWEASRANRELSASKLGAARALSDAVVRGGADPDRRRLPYAGLYDAKEVTATSLAAAASQITQQQLGRDFSVETEPPSARAHVYWRRDPARPVTAKSISISADIFIRDASGYRSGSVAAFVLGVVAVAYLVGCLRTRSLWPFGDLFPHGPRRPWFDQTPLPGTSNSDAMIAVLLLVPGFLYTRLRLPRRHSIAGHQRRIPRFVAYSANAAALAIAAAFAATDDPAVIRAVLAIGIVGPLLLVALLPIASRGAGRELLPATKHTPRWILTGPRVHRSERRGLPFWLLWRPLLRIPDSHFSTETIEAPKSWIRTLAERIVRSGSTGGSR
jgi:hypothetical protein